MGLKIQPTKVSIKRFPGNNRVEFTLYTRHTVEIRHYETDIFHRTYFLYVDGDELFRKQIPFVGVIDMKHDFVLDGLPCILTIQGGSAGVGFLANVVLTANGYKVFST